jgi:UPF0755 protein
LKKQAAIIMPARLYREDWGLVRRVLLACLLLAIGLLVWGGWWINRPLDLRQPVVDLAIKPGTAPRAVAQQAVQAGVQTAPRMLYGWFRLSGQARAIRAGNYELTAPTTPRDLLSKLVRGDEALRYLTLVEGWTFKQVRAALARAEQLKAETQGMSSEEIMRALDRPGLPAEGHFFPDTYGYAKGSSDLAVLRRALTSMDQHLAQAWQSRASDSVLQTPEQLLTLASIVEKETGRASDRGLVARVFINRLAIGMPLQTDPTVIYGLGDAFDGNLRKRDLQRDTPWNTYTRGGLPPTPIAMPGRASLQAAAQPAPGKMLYFVARGDGSSQFSETLEAHNRAVRTYQRGP